MKSLSERVRGALVRPVVWALALMVLGLCAGCSKEAKAKRYLAAANKDYTAGDYQKAEIEYRKVLQVTPGNAEAVAHLGLIYQAQGRAPQAYLALKAAVGLLPQDMDLRLKFSLTELELGGLKDARKDAEAVLASQAGQAEALLVLAETALTKKEAQDTVSQVNKMRQQGGEKAGYHLALATLYFRLGQLTNVSEELTRAQALDAKLPALCEAWGNLYWMSNDLANAEASFKAGAELSPIRSSRRLKYADFKRKTGEGAEAKKLLEEMTQKAPDYLPGWNMLAEIAASENRADDAEAILKRVLSQDAINYQATLLDAKLKLSKNEVSEATESLLRLAKFYRQAEVQVRLAQCYFLNGEDAKGEGALKQALLIEPNNTEATLGLAELNIRKGDPVPAILSLEQLVRRRPDLPQAHLLLAGAYVAQHNYEQALAVFQRMQPLFPKNPQVPFYIANLLVQMKQPAEARKACAQALEMAPDFLPPLEVLVDLDIDEKNLAGALERLNKEVQRRPSVPELNLLVAKVYMAQKDYTNAEATLVKTIQMAPDLRTSYLMLAQMYVKSGKAQEALDKLNSFVTRTNDAPALMQIGMIQESLTNYASARDAYEKVLQVNPRFAAALNNLAYLYTEQFHQFDKAAELAEQARKMYPNDPSINDTLGWVLYRKGEFPRALSLISLAATAAPNEPEIQCHLGMVRYSLGQEGPARLALQRAVEGEKDFPGKAEARRRLAILSIPAEASDAGTQAKLEKEVLEDPADPIALVRLGNVYSHNGAKDKAVKAYEQALAQNPKSAFVLSGLAQLYSEPGSLKNTEKALEYAKDAHAAAPDDGAISQLLGHLVCESGDYKWASSLLQDVSLRNPGQPGVLFDLARSYYGLGQLTPAERALNDALSGGTGFPQAEEAKRLLSFIVAYRDPGQRAAVTGQVEAVLKSDPNNVPALMVLQANQQAAGNFAEAKKTLEQVRGLNQLFVPAMRDLAILSFDHFPDDAGIQELANKARESFPDDRNLARVLGMLAYRRADYASASRFLKQAAGSEAANPDTLYYLGMAQYQLKAKSDSKDSLNRALAMNLDPKLAADAKKVLAELK